MLDRIDKSVEKTMVTLYLPMDIAKRIRVVSAERLMTQSKYIADLVAADVGVGKLNMEALEGVLWDVLSNSSNIGTDGVKPYVAEILTIFGIEQGGD